MEFEREYRFKPHYSPSSVRLNLTGLVSLCPTTTPCFTSTGMPRRTRCAATLTLLPVVYAYPVEQRSPIITRDTPTSSPPPTTILHQPQISQIYVNFGILGQNLNGISVSGPPFFGERPYPRQFHPVEMTPIFTDFPPTNLCNQTSSAK